MYDVFKLTAGCDKYTAGGFTWIATVDTMEAARQIIADIGGTDGIDDSYYISQRVAFVNARGVNIAF